MANACFLEGNVSEARKYAARASALLPGHFLARSLAAMLAAADGDSGAAKAALQSLEAEARINHFAAMRQALCYAKLGERDEAILWMQRSLDLGNHSWYAWTRHPWMQPLQTDPRFQKIAGAMRADLDKVQPEAVQVYEEIRAKRLQGERWNGRQAGAAPSPRRRGRAVQQHSHVLSECRKAV